MPTYDELAIEEYLSATHQSAPELKCEATRFIQNPYEPLLVALLRHHEDSD